MFVYRFRSALFLGVLLAPGSAGCGGRAFYPVSGQVLANGKPAEGVLVVFHAEDEADPVQPTATVQADGSFVLRSFVPSDRSVREGAPAGKYRVSCVWYPADLSKYLGQEILPDRLQGKYANGKTSGLTVQVEEKPNQLSPFQLTAR